MGVTGSLEGKDVYYDKNKLIFIWEDGHTEEDRIDVGLSKHDFNPQTQSLKDYSKESLDELNERLGKNYVLDFKEGNEEKEREYLHKANYKDLALHVGNKYTHKDLGKVTLKSIMVNEAPESETNPYDVRFEDENHKGVQSGVATFYNSVQGETGVSDIKSTIEGLKVLLSIETDRAKKKEIRDVISGLKLINN